MGGGLTAAVCHLQRGGGEGRAGALANFPVSCVLTLGWGLESGGAQETFQGGPWGQACGDTWHGIAGCQRGQHRRTH